MPPRKVSRKDLKKPDEFISWTSTALGFVVTHRRQFYLAVVIILLLAGGAFGWLKYSSYRSARSQADFSRALETVRGNRPPAEQINAMTEFLTRHPRGETAPYARYYLALAAFNTGKYDDSIVRFKAILTHRTTNSAVTHLVHIGIAYSFEAKRDYASSETHFQQAADLPGSFPKDQALFGLARVQEKLNRKKEAAATYKKIISLYSGSPLAQYAREKAALLEG